MLTIQRRITVVDTDDALTADDFSGPDGGDRVVDLLLEHPTALGRAKRIGRILARGGSERE